MKGIIEREEQATKGLVTLVRKIVDLEMYHFQNGEQISVEVKGDQEMRISNIYYSMVYAPKYRLGKTEKIGEYRRESFYTIFEYNPFIGALFPEVSRGLPPRNPKLIEVGKEESITPSLNRSQQRLHMHALEHAWNIWRIGSEAGGFVDATNILYDVKQELENTFMTEFLDRFYSEKNR